MIYNGKISIIVPINNSQDYIVRCLESILKQTYTNYEVLLVNDGSNDESERICQQYVNEYPHIFSLYSREHLGQGSARNCGVQHANGKYIGFVDADDDIHPNMYKEMIRLAENREAEVVICDVKLFHIDSETFEIQHSINHGRRDLSNYLQYGINLCSPCNKLFRKELFDNRKFKEMTYEDMELIPVVVSFCDRVEFIEKHFYNYRLRKNSTTNDIDKFVVSDFLYAIKSSIKNVNPIYKNEFIYWHARSILDSVNRNREMYREVFRSFINENRNLFWENKLIRKDIYVREIYDIPVKRPINECKPRFKFSILSTWPIDKFNIISNGISVNIKEDVQFIHFDKTHDIWNEIEGEYVLFIDNEVDTENNFFDHLYELIKVYKRDCDVFAIPINSRISPNKIINLENKYKDFSFKNYIYLINFKLIKKMNIIDHLSSKEAVLLYYLSEKPLIGILQQIKIQSKEQYNLKIDSFADKYNITSNMILPLLHTIISVRLGIPKFIQFFVMKIMKEMLEMDISRQYINELYFQSYKEKVKEVLVNVDDIILNSIPRTTPEHRVFFFHLKYGKDAEVVYENEQVELRYNQNNVYCQDNTYTIFEFANYDNGILMIEGRTICLNCKEDEMISFYAVSNGIIYPAQIVKRNCNRYCLDELLYKGIEFRVNIPVLVETPIYIIEFFYVYRGMTVRRNDLRFAKYFPIGSNIESSYWKKDDRVLTYQNGQLIFRLCGRKGKILHEKKFLAEIKRLVSQKKYHEILILRILAIFLKKYYRKKIWLVSDKGHRGDDNGEAFFKYMNSSKNLKKKINTYYVIDKKYEFYHRIKKIGRIILFGSWKHKLLSICCDLHFAAYVHVSMVCPLSEDREYYKDVLCEKRIVFIQHGITQNNLSSALNKYNQNFHSIITANREERNSYINYDYYYNSNQIKLLGFPRYDFLKDLSKKIITIAPTWRRNLFGEFDQKAENYILKDDFNKSDYYIFYCELLNDARVLNTAKEYGYEIHFIPHPVFFPYMEAFCINTAVHVHGKEVSYNQMYAESSLFITDYSSVVFDFAYLKKPIFYIQFDKEQFYESQYEKGNFDYSKDGFGEVVETLDETINLLMEYMKSGCIMKEKYRQRVDKFFTFHDNKNCERIFEAYYIDR